MLAEPSWFSCVQRLLLVIRLGGKRVQADPIVEIVECDSGGMWWQCPYIFVWATPACEHEWIKEKRVLWMFALVCFFCFFMFLRVWHVCGLGKQIWACFQSGWGECWDRPTCRGTASRLSTHHCGSSKMSMCFDSTLAKDSFPRRRNCFLLRETSWKTVELKPLTSLPTREKHWKSVGVATIRCLFVWPGDAETEWYPKVDWNLLRGNRLCSCDLLIEWIDPRNLMKSSGILEGGINVKSWNTSFCMFFRFGQRSYMTMEYHAHSVVVVQAAPKAGGDSYSTHCFVSNIGSADFD